MKKITVIGGGLAGSEAAFRIANSGIDVELWEMRPIKMTAAHHTGYLGELVCSNSLKANHLGNAAGLLKEEMRKLNSLIIKAADSHSVPAGQALAVDRDRYAREVTESIINHPRITVIRQEVKSGMLAEFVKEGIVVIASGPLTSESLARDIQKILGAEYLYFFDAAAPIVTYESLNHDIVYKASRYGEDQNNGDYLNCPMTKDEYEKFWEELVNAERAPVKDFEKGKFFEGCLPIEELASRGIKTLAFGPLKPVGLTNPVTGELPYAVVQLRQDNYEGTLYNLVGFQTRLKWGEQKRVFSMIPGLENAEFVRYGVMHRNTFINSPELLKPTLQLKSEPKILFAGQITGVEGYIESAATGIIAGINAVRIFRNEDPIIFPFETTHGALTHYITTSVQKSFQPMNINYGILPPLDEKIRDKALKKQKIAERSLSKLQHFINQYNL